MCKIEKVLGVVSKSDAFYVMHVRFIYYSSKEKRISLVEDELINRFPIIKDKVMFIDEYLGKRYNEYRYVIRVEDE